MRADQVSSVIESPGSALFLDRDGVINTDYGYVHRRDQFEFVDGIFDLAKAACDLGYRLVVVTNQAGIGRGMYSEDEFWELTRWMCGRFEEARAPIDRVYFSPYHPTAGLGPYLADHPSRKPRPGMLLQAQRDLQLDLARSVLIGDRPTDIQAGVAAGVGTNLLYSPTSDPTDVQAHRIATLREAKRYLEALRVQEIQT